MARVNFIIRACNRLEYTSLTIREIDRLAGYDNYKMIVVDQKHFVLSQTGPLSNHSASILYHSAGP